MTTAELVARARKHRPAVGFSETLEIIRALADECEQLDAEIAKCKAWCTALAGINEAAKRQIAEKDEENARLRERLKSAEDALRWYRDHSMMYRYADTHFARYGENP